MFDFFLKVVRMSLEGELVDPDAENMKLIGVVFLATKKSRFLFIFYLFSRICAALIGFKITRTNKIK